MSITIIGRNFRILPTKEEWFQAEGPSTPAVKYAYVDGVESDEFPCEVESDTRMECPIPQLPQKYQVDIVEGKEGNKTVAVYVKMYKRFVDNPIHFTYANATLWNKTETGATMYTCMLKRDEEEGKRVLEQGWFGARSMSWADLTLDFTHIPKNLVYGAHYRIAIYIAPSFCDEQKCNSVSCLHLYL